MTRRFALLLACLVASLTVACARSTVRDAEPVPAADQIGIRVVNPTDGTPLVWLDPGDVHYRIGVTAPDTTDVLLFPAEWIDSTAVVRAYPLPFVCYFTTTVRRADAGRVIELRLPETDDWPERDPAVSDTTSLTPCDQSDVPSGYARLREMREFNDLVEP